MSTGTLHALGTRDLPSPAGERFRPLRAGIRNVWEYDNQEFWLSGGWLILRGPNTAGKSKALELLLPFVLDGETRPERLDPFGGRSKTMYWNLLDFDESRRSEIGYCWVEFGRVDAEAQEHFVTCIVGMRATRGAERRVETWFAVTPLRIGLDVDLAGPDGRLLTPDRFRQAIDGRGRCPTTARDHRMAVDQALFGLGPERFEGLLHLLLQLRRPKLSEKLDVAKLAGVLSEALPPLERARLELLAQAFARLDADAAELEVLEKARDELESFLAAYRHYARIQTRVRADGVRSAQSEFDRITRTERQQRELADAASEELAKLEERRSELGEAAARLRGQLEGLDLSKVQHLDLVERAAAEAERVARASAQRASGDAHQAVEADADAQATLATAEAAAARRDARVSMLEAASREVGLGEVLEAHRPQLLARPQDARRGLEAAADRRTDQAKVVQAAAAAAERARREAEVAEERADRAEEGRRQAEIAEEQAGVAVELAGEAFAASVTSWSEFLDPAARERLSLPAELAADALAAVLAADGDGGAARAIAQALCAPARETVAAERAGAAAEVRALTARQAELEARRETVAAERDDAPSPAPGRPADRPDGCAGLWRCVEFDSSVGQAQQAFLEAALEAAGFLDALVTPEGHLLDASTLDTVLTGTPSGGQSLTAWLVPDPAGPLPPAVVARALAAVGAGAGTGSAWVDLDGSWANGPLSGRWAKTAPEFVGASARAAARARRLVEIDRALAELAVALAAARAAEASLAALGRQIEGAERSFPVPTGLRDALRDRDRLARALEEAAQVAAQAAARLKAAQDAVAKANDALGLAEQEAGCRASDVDRLLTALGRWRARLAGTIPEIERAVDAWERAEAADRRAAGRRQAAEASSGDARRDAEEAGQRRGEADEVRRSMGADVDAILRRKAELEASLGLAREELGGLAQRRDGVRDQLAAARAKLEVTQREREQRDEERAQRLQGLVLLATTELGPLALGPIDVERDLTQVTAGVAFARAAAERLADVEADKGTQDQAVNRLHDAFVHLRARLGADFDPHLDSQDGANVCYAKLNGAPVGAVDLASALNEQVRRRRETLTDEERELIERHLLAEVGSHLGERIHTAWSQLQRMNQQLALHGTRSGVRLHLLWEPDPEVVAGSAEALKLLKREVHLLSAEERAVLAAFLADRVRAAREGAEGADAVERMAAALDYRRWHRFVVMRRSNGRDERFTARTQAHGSGGEQAKLAHLPLFAATAGYYASALPTCPRLLMLDEAFAGIDDQQRADCMAMLVDLGLDAVLTNYNEWGCYPEVPSVAIYQLERTDGQRGVAALRFVWDGRRLREDDPFLATIEPPDVGLLALGDEGEG
ncbi:MAG TPA: TIGR02680 family protein [Actinomycetota bacterium]|nr:TIGR02680 family protein [Actinomycetota bacterium]